MGSRDPLLELADLIGRDMYEIKGNLRTLCENQIVLRDAFKSLQEEIARTNKKEGE
jgi:hypothetical protein